MTFPSLNIEKLRHDTIQKVKKEKQLYHLILTSQTQIMNIVKILIRKKL